MIVIDLYCLISTKDQFYKFYKFYWALACETDHVFDVYSLDGGRNWKKVGGVGAAAA